MGTQYVDPWDLLASDMITWRRRLHERPELGYEELETSSMVAKLLRTWGFSVQEGLAGTGVLGTMVFSTTGPSILLRADMDALPIHETSEKSYASVHDHVMHACGHDGHTASLLGAACYLSRMQPSNGTLHVLFQPAEECTNSGGARLISEQALDHLTLDAIYAFHTWPDLPRGAAAIHQGTVMAAADFFTVELSGGNAHAGMPHLGRDTIVAAAQLVNALQCVVSREAVPGQATVVSIGKLQAGQVGTQIADAARLEGTIRALTDEGLEQIRLAMSRIVEGVCVSQRITGHIRFEGAVPATVNTARSATVAERALVEVLGKQNVRTNELPSMAAEDFSLLLKKWPGCFFWMGGGSGDASDKISLHDSRFDFDDTTLVSAAQVFVRIAQIELELARPNSESGYTR